MINTDYIKELAYGFIVMGNAEEEQLTVLISPGQSKKIKMCIIKTSVDAGMEILLPVHYETSQDLITRLDFILRDKWPTILPERKHILKLAKKYMEGE